MDTLGKTPQERAHIKKLLRQRHGSIEKAAEKIKLSKFTLSRILNGKKGDLGSLVKILQGTGHLEKRKYRFPADNLDTFMYLNGIMNFTLL